jgi:hypothetical protein
MIKPPYTVFWGEMSAFEHFVQIYEKETVFLDTLADFIGDGLKKGEGTIAILTRAHRAELESRLSVMGISLNIAQSSDQLILLDAEETLSEFMINDWPDEQAFTKVVMGTVNRAAKGGRKVRAFGEMVALMWAQGQCGATVMLERMWSDLCKRESLPLFCAYPKAGFTEHPSDSINRVCFMHSNVLGG